MSFRALEESVLGICNSTFGTPVTYTPTVGSPVSINGVFDNAYVEVNGVSSLQPTLRIQLSDLELEPTKGDEVTIDSTAYVILASQKDGYGGALLILQKE
jgi:hypothetical protein